MTGPRLRNFQKPIAKKAVGLRISLGLRHRATHKAIGSNIVFTASQQSFKKLMFSVVSVHDSVRGWSPVQDPVSLPSVNVPSWRPGLVTCQTCSLKESPSRPVYEN